MPESARDLMAVFLGLIVLWFLLGALINEGRLSGPHGPDARRRQSLTGRPDGGRFPGR